MNPEQHEWCLAAQHMGGGFVKAFATACLKADLSNLRIIVTALNQLMVKYPEYGRKRPHEDFRG